MAAVSEEKMLEFVKTVVLRGLGLYGQKTMAQICYESGIALTDKNEVDWLEENHLDSIRKLLINYGSRNLPAKMTAIVLAKQHGFEVPPELLAKKKKRGIFKRLKRK